MGFWAEWGLLMLDFEQARFCNFGVRGASCAQLCGVMWVLEGAGPMVCSPQEMKRMLNKARWMVLAAGLVAAAAPMTMQAQQVPGPHPAYLHALSDLRAARHYLNDGWAWAPVKHDDNAAIREIDAAIGEIKKAAIDDGKGLNDPFTIDTRLSPHDRFRKAKELLASAQNDLSRAEDVPSSRGLRDRAIGHVDEAHRIVDTAERTAHWE
jgi:hypothetical protein